MDYLDRSCCHPLIEDLDEYLQGGLLAKEALQVRHHLIFCRLCRDLLLDLVCFLETSDTLGRLWSAELASAWEECRPELR